MNVTVVTPIPTPYRDPFWQVFGSRSDVKLDVVYCASGKADRPWMDHNEYSFGQHFPRSRNLLGWTGWGQSCYWNSGLKTILKSTDPDVVMIGGYNHLTMLRTMRYCRRNRIPWILMNESWKKRSGIVGALKHRWIKRLFRRAAGATPTGKLASQHLADFGIPVSRQCCVPNVPDIEEIQRLAAEYRRNISQTKGALNLPLGKRQIVFVGRMIPKKRPLMAVRAFARYLAETKCKEVNLVMVGDGPLKEKAEEHALELGCQKSIHFTGFLAPEAVIKTISVSNLFVLPSSETWGVAPIEAIACGVPAVVSDELGCQADLFDADATRHVVTAGDEDALVNCLLGFDLPGDDELPSSNKNWLSQNNYREISNRLVPFLGEHVANGPATEST